MDTHFAIILTAVLCAVSCALLGNFLVLRKMSMMGDAISHAVLPGLVIAFLITGSRDSVWMFVGAAVVGLLTALFTQFVHRLGKVDEGASMGVVFTTLFAIGLVLVVSLADYTDLDADCVLYGVLESAPLDTVGLFGMETPRAAIRSGVMLIINGLFVFAFYKELKISSFDPTLASTVGIQASVMHYLLMALVAVTTVASFDTVGSILVIAMLIVPPATAYLLTDRLGVMILLSVVIAALAAVLGHLSAVTVPPWFGVADTISAGMIATMSGLLFGTAMLFAPRRGVLSRLVHRLQLSLNTVREDILGLLYRLEEAELDPSRLEPLPVLLRKTRGTPKWQTWMALGSLRRRGEITREDQLDSLTPAGYAAARRLVRSRRLWEMYLDKHTDMPSEHLHYTAEQLEHVTDTTLRRRLEQDTDTPQADPHGKRIPRTESLDEG
jgi:manganese/zinc/iron transport system permease protein